MPPNHPPSRSERRVALLLTLGLAACNASTQPPTYPTTDRWEPAQRQPDGVALDPLPSGVQPTSSSKTPSPWPVALRPPLPAEKALEVLQRFLDALIQEDMATLQPLLSTRGTWTNPQSRASAPLWPHFRERARRLDYPQLIGLPLLRESEAEVYTEEDLQTSLPGRPQRPQDMKSEDVLLRVRILTPRVGAERFFGDEVLLLLHPENGAYQIQLWQEEFQLP